MKLREIPQRLKSWLGGWAEGQPRGPWQMFGEFGTPFEISNPDTAYYQRNIGISGGDARNVAIVYACVMLYCRAISQCLPKHLKRNDDGGDEQSFTSPASRVLRYPNSYEHWNQFVQNVVAEMLFEGESLAIKVYDDRYAVTALQRVPRRSWTIHVDPDSREIFYGINSTDLFDKPDMLIPQRDVVHFRQHTPRHPLIGESPVKAAAMAIGVNVSLNRSQLFFFSQMSRPSGVLSTDMSLTSDQMRQLRAAFSEQSKAWATGGVPILSSGLKWTGLNVTQADSQLIEQQKLSALDVARVFSVPMALLAEGSGPQAGTNALITTWLSIGLGAVIENIERTLDRCFDLAANEHIQLDTTPLLRSDPAARAEMWSKNIQSGTMTINEVRLREGLKPVDGGDVPMVQQQMVGIDLLQQLHAATISSKLKPAEEPKPESAPAEEPKPEPAKEADPEITKALVIALRDHKRKSA